MPLRFFFFPLCVRGCLPLHCMVHTITRLYQCILCLQNLTHGKKPNRNFYISINNLGLGSAVCPKQGFGLAVNEIKLSWQEVNISFYQMLLVEVMTLNCCLNFEIHMSFPSQPLHANMTMRSNLSLPALNLSGIFLHTVCVY